jgi:HPt (histidine-containing phosphotransfer) domain-containing protein
VVTLREKLIEMHRARASEDHRELAALAHWLKGAGGTCGFDEFTEPSLALEQLAKAENSAQYEKAIKRLESMTKAIVVEGQLALTITE